MVESLPSQLNCLTLEYVIDDPDTIEKYLAIDPEGTAKCIPIVIYHMFGPVAEKYGLSTGMFNAAMLLHVLEVLWDINRLSAPQKQLAYAINHNATYMVPYLIDLLGSDADINYMIPAAEDDNVDMLRVLNYAQEEYHGDYNPVSRLASALYFAAQEGKTNATKYLVEQLIKHNAASGIYDIALYRAAVRCRLTLPNISDYRRVAEVLLKAGASPLAHDGRAITSAQINNNVGVLTALRNAGYIA